MARATWSGAISFGLVSVPVKLFTAVRSHTIRFRQLNAETMNRVRHRKVDAQSGEEVSSGDIVKGYELGDGRYVVVEKEELEALDPEASRTIQIEDFVDLRDIDPVYFDRPYYLAPDGEAATKPYALLVEAMARSGRVAIARFVMRSNEHLAAIRARDGLLVLETMHYADEVADPGEIAELDIADVEVSERELEMAEQLISNLVVEFDPERYEDHHQERVMEFIEEKAEGREVTVPEPAEQEGGVIDLMKALEESLEQQGGEAPEGSYADMSKDELYDLARERDIPGRSDMTKDELTEALRRADEAAA